MVTIIGRCKVFRKDFIFYKIWKGSDRKNGGKVTIRIVDIVGEVCLELQRGQVRQGKKR